MLNFEAMIEKLVKSFHYAPGHYGDPQWEVPDYMYLKIPEDMYAIEVDEDGQAWVDGKFFSNKSQILKFSEEDGPDDRDTETVLKEILKNLSENSEWVMKTVETLKNDHPDIKTLELKLATENEDVDVLENPEDKEKIEKWLKETITKHFNEFCSNQDNWEVVKKDDWDESDI